MVTLRSMICELEMQSQIFWKRIFKSKNKDSIEYITIRWLFCNSGTLEDRHVWELAKKFTNSTDLRTLALTGLKLERCTIDAKMCNNERDIWEAANKILQEWCKRQKNQHKAYTKLLKALTNCDFVLMATELKNSVEKPALSSSSSSSSSSTDDDDS